MTMARDREASMSQLANKAFWLTASVRHASRNKVMNATALTEPLMMLGRCGALSPVSGCFAPDKLGN